MGTLPKVEALLEIISRPSHSEKYVIAMASNTCVICQGAAVDFRGALVRLEYACSGIWLSCQDEYVSGTKNCGDAPEYRVNNAEKKFKSYDAWATRQQNIPFFITMFAGLNNVHPYTIQTVQEDMDQ